MTKASILSFAVEPLSNEEPLPSIVPVLNGSRLTDLVEAFERSRSYEPVGGYAGLVPAFFTIGPLDQYFMATSNEVFTTNGFYLLGCECGEVGCWPLVARIIADDRVVQWKDFKQPLRPDRDYSGFGPFLFDADQYQRSVLELTSAFGQA
jgi:hypothetical protein